jgi:hydrogenase large subunit
MLGVVTSLAGQWPHATYMAPGGVTCQVTAEKLARCEASIDEYQSWYEKEVLGCSSDQWLGLQTSEDFLGWLEGHLNTGAGLYASFGRSIGLQNLGQGTPYLLSCGCYPSPGSNGFLMKGGYLNGTHVEPFDHHLVREHTRYSWFADQRPTHPWDSVTKAEHGHDRGQYSHAKATRYADQVVQMGPMVDLFLAGDPLIVSWMQAEGPNTWLRQFTRLHRPVLAMQFMRQTIAELREEMSEPAMIWPSQVPDDARGFGAINAARGTLSHWVCIREGKIANYQIITPTTWNASPRDSDGRRGHWEESFVGLTIADPENPVELGHIVRSHDACLVCTTHMIRTGQRGRFDHQH